jgi:hypothetical protein
MDIAEAAAVVGSNWVKLVWHGSGSAGNVIFYRDWPKMEQLALAAQFKDENRRW